MDRQATSSSTDTSGLAFFDRGGGGSSSKYLPGGNVENELQNENGRAQSRHPPSSVSDCGINGGATSAFGFGSGSSSFRRCDTPGFTAGVKCRGGGFGSGKFKAVTGDLAAGRSSSFAPTHDGNSGGAGENKQVKRGLNRFLSAGTHPKSVAQKEVRVEKQQFGVAKTQFGVAKKRLGVAKKTATHVGGNPFSGSRKRGYTTRDAEGREAMGDHEGGVDSGVPSKDGTDDGHDDNSFFPDCGSTQHSPRLHYHGTGTSPISMRRKTQRESSLISKGRHALRDEVRQMRTDVRQTHEYILQAQHQQQQQQQRILQQCQQIQQSQIQHGQNHHQLLSQLQEQQKQRRHGNYARSPQHPLWNELMFEENKWEWHISLANFLDRIHDHPRRDEIVYIFLPDQPHDPDTALKSPASAAAAAARPQNVSPSSSGRGSPELSPSGSSSVNGAGKATNASSPPAAVVHPAATSCTVSVPCATNVPQASASSVIAFPDDQDGPHQPGLTSDIASTTHGVNIKDMSSTHYNITNITNITSGRDMTTTGNATVYTSSNTSSNTFSNTPNASPLDNRVYNNPANLCGTPPTTIPPAHDPSRDTTIATSVSGMAWADTPGATTGVATRIAAHLAAGSDLAKRDNASGGGSHVNSAKEGAKNEAGRSCANTTIEIDAGLAKSLPPHFRLSAIDTTTSLGAATRKRRRESVDEQDYDGSASTEGDNADGHEAARADSDGVETGAGAATIFVTKRRRL